MQPSHHLSHVGERETYAGSAITRLSEYRDRSLFSYRSVLSILSASSVLSIASAVSLLSIGSFASILSIGSSHSVLSIGSDGGFLSLGRSRRRGVDPVP